VEFNLSTFPDGLFQYGGQPVGAKLWASPWSTVYFVDGYNGSDAFDGLKPTAAKKTIAAAVALCGRGDVVYIRPYPYGIGHGMERYAEDVTITASKGALGVEGSASYPILSPSDISIIGCVNTVTPQMGARWKYATATCLTNTAPALHVENIGFFAEDYKCVSLLSNGTTDTQRGMDGTTFYNCDFKGGGVTGSDGLSCLAFNRCRFEPKYNGEVDNALTITCNTNPGSKLTIENCEFLDGSDGTAADGPWIVLATVLKDVIIRDCYFGQAPTNTTYITATDTTVEGVVQNCYFGHANMTLTTEITGTGLHLSGIYDLLGLVVA
jgi:hypothetical protein